MIPAVSLFNQQPSNVYPPGMLPNQADNDREAPAPPSHSRSSGSYSYSSSGGEGGGAEIPKRENRVLTFADEHGTKLCRFQWYKDPYDDLGDEEAPPSQKKACCVIS